MSRSSGNEKSGCERRELRYEGRVQGVGFRFTAQSVARRYEVTGFVRNMPDGSVQLIAEGAPSQLELFLDDVAETLGRFIEHSLRTVGTATGEFDGFGIRF